LESCEECYEGLYLCVDGSSLSEGLIVLVEGHPHIPMCYHPKDPMIVLIGVEVMGILEWNLNGRNCSKADQG
jgi:hypothetical protein